MNVHIALLVIITVLCSSNHAKIIKLRSLEFKSNGVPNLGVVEKNNDLNADSGDKNDFKVLKDIDNKDKTEDDAEQIQVTSIYDNDDKEIEEKLYTTFSQSKNQNISEEAAKLADIVLLKIKEMLGHEKNEGGRRVDGYKVYVPISDNIVDPDFIPQGLVKKKAVTRNGLNLIDLGYDDV